MTPRSDLKMPLAFAGLLLGGALLSLLMFDAPRLALALVILTLVITLAVLRELTFGDR